MYYCNWLELSRGNRVMVSGDYDFVKPYSDKLLLAPYNTEKYDVTLITTVEES